MRYKDKTRPHRADLPAQLHQRHRLSVVLHVCIIINLHRGVKWNQLLVQVKVMDQDLLAEKQSSVTFATCAGDDTKSYNFISASHLDVNQTTTTCSCKKQPRLHRARDNTSCDRQRRRCKPGGGASTPPSQLTAPPKEESTFSGFKDGRFSTPPDWFLLGMDQPTDVHLPPSLKPFPYHSPDMIPLSLSAHNSQGLAIALAGDMGMNPSQEEVGRNYARGRHEIVLGNATIVVEECPSITQQI